MINRHNYEEFFLMYVDDELTAQQRAEVELFVKHNQDLAPELEMLLQTKLAADDKIMFADKNALLKSDSNIAIDNYEEYFLLYIDNELNSTQKESVERFVLQHPQFQNAFTLLKQAVLQPEQVIFEDKASLYRKEKRRVVPLFLRYAAAAALIGIAALIWWAQTGSGIKHQVAVVKNNSVQKAQPSEIIKDSNSNKHIPETLQPRNNAVASIQQRSEQSRDVAVKKDKDELKRDRKKATELNASKDLVALNRQDKTDENHKDIPGTKTGVINNTLPDRNTTVIADNNNSHNDASGSKTVNQPNNSNDSNNQDNNTNSYAKTAVYKELNTDDEDNRSLYVGVLELNKNKVRGFVKKVGGLFSGKSKNADNDDGKLQIANLQLNTN